jgi:hypothetical protein
MDYIVGNPLLSAPSLDQPVVKRFAGETTLQPINSSSASQRSKYLTQGKDMAEEQRKKAQDTLNAQIAAESGKGSINLGEYGQIQLS